MRILIGADFIPTVSNSNLFASGDIKQLLGEDLINLFMTADYRVVNLEEPLTDHANPIKKRGPNLSANPDCITAYKRLNINLVTLANNHIMDQGEEGLQSTIKILKDSNIAWVGAGKNINEAKEPYIVDYCGEKIGFYACCEHEFSIATEKAGGANPIDVFESVKDIRVLKEKCSYLIVLYHGGREYYRYPVPFQQRASRAFIDAGADLVISQHSHCVGSKEEYNGKTAIYGQGNLLFDLKDDEFWETGMLICVDTLNNKIDYYPVKKNGNTVRLADSLICEKVISLFIENSKKITSDAFTREAFRKEAFKSKKYYLRLLHGNSLSDKIRDKFFNSNLYSSEAIIDLFDIINCESHLELLKEILK